MFWFLHGPCKRQHLHFPQRCRSPLDIPFVPSLAIATEYHFASPLLVGWPGLALVRLHWVEHNFGRVCRGVALEAFAPVIANGIGEDGASLIECRRCDTTTDIGIAFEAMLGILVPEVERAVTTCCAESSVLRVKRDVVDCIYVCCVTLRRVAVALE